MPTLPTQTQVLVVGAGPNGLACAVTLAGLGLEVTVVDALPAGKYGARACLVHARTLEALDTIGLAKPLMTSGLASKGVTFHGDANKLIEVHVSLLDHETKFPTVLLLPQHNIENIFQDRLAKEQVEIHRGCKAVDMKESPGKGLDVVFEDGRRICAQYVIGADGSRSTIRSLADIKFTDPHTGTPYDYDVLPSSALQITLADVYFEEPLPPTLPRDAVSWHLNKRLLMCPLPLPQSPYDSTSDKVDLDSKQLSFWRIGIVIPIGTPVPPRHPDLEFLQQEVNARKPWAQDVTIARLVTAATYRVRSAVAETFFKRFGTGSVLLVGDAAHVHSPTGGQGMNLGLCDAIALGHAIRGHVDANVHVPVRADDALLVDYSASRTKTAEAVIGMVKRLTRAINLQTGWRTMLRNTVMYVLGSFTFTRKKVAWKLSGLVHRDD